MSVVETGQAVADFEFQQILDFDSVYTSGS